MRHTGKTTWPHAIVTVELTTWELERISEGLRVMDKKHQKDPSYSTLRLEVERLIAKTKQHDPR